MRYGAILTAFAFVLLVACKSTKPPTTTTANQPPPVQYEQGPQARSTPHALFTTGIAVAPIQHSPWTTTTNDPTVTLQAQQPVSISTTSNISLYAPSLIAWTNAVNGRLNVCNTINGIAGAVGNGSTDCYASITNALAQAIAQNNSLYFPPGRYLISKTITIPARSTLVGDLVDPAYKSALAKRAVIVTSGDFTAIQSPRLTFPFDALNNWSQFISIRDLYIEGVLTQSSATATNTSVGLDLTGTEFTDIQNVHIEGFGTGMVAHNGSELVFQNIFVQNNFTGFTFQRTLPGANTYDMMATCYNLVALNNQISVTLDFPRSVVLFGGEFICGTNKNINLINGKGDSQAVFNGCSFENHSPVYPIFSTDTNGIGQLLVKNCNLETDQERALIETYGVFDYLELSACNLQRSAGRTNALIWLHTEPAGAGNGDLRQCRVSVHGNTPGWWDTWVRNDLSSARPENDFFPPNYVNLNPMPDCDHANDGILAIGNDYTFLSTNAICGLSRVSWQNTNIANNTITLTPGATNNTRGIDHLYITSLLYDNGGTNVPVVAVGGWNTNGPDYFVLGPAKLGEFLSAEGKTFTKWAWTAVLKDFTLVTNGISAVELGNIFGVPNTNTDIGDYGVERFCVYAPAQKNPDGFLFPISAVQPGTNAIALGIDHGRHKVGDFLLNSDMTNNPSIYGWFCATNGHPGIWLPIMSLVPPDLFGTFTGGTNTPGTLARGFGVSTAWPFYFQTMYSMGSVDYYINFDCFMDGGTFDNPTFTGSNSGGRIIRIHTGNVVNDGVLDFGHTTTGTGQLFVLDMQVDSELTTNQLPILVRDNLSLTMKRILMDTNRFLYLAP